MARQTGEYEDEIDLFELLRSIWDGKWTVVLTAILFGACGLAYALYTPTKYNVETEIRPITSSDFQVYRDFNSLGFNAISRDELLSLFIEYLDDRELIAEAFQSTGFVEPLQNETDEEYQIRLFDKASDIQLAAPSDESNSNSNESSNYWTLSFETNDQALARAFLNYLYKWATDDVQQFLANRFDTSVAIANKQKSFKLEDIERSISNKLADYDKQVANRLEYLKEQAAIARSLGVAKNTIEAQTFSTQNGVVASFQSNSPFYLRGYEAIEKEIELLQARTNKEAFVDGLLELQQSKRGIVQDPLVHRAADLLELTPLKSDAPFKAVTAFRSTSDYTSKSKKSLILIAAILLGGVVGMFYVLVRAGFRKRASAAVK